MSVRADERFERDLPDAMRSAVAEFRGPSPDLIERGIRRGRQQRRTRMAVGATVVAVLAVVLGQIGGSSVLDGAFGRSVDEQGPAAVAPTGRLPLGRELIPYLRTALPGGGRTDRFEPEGAAPVPGDSRISGTYTGPGGSTSLAVELTRPLPGSVEDLWWGAHCAPNAPPGYTCTRSPEPDGGTLTMSVGPVGTDGQRVSRQVVYTRADAVQVHVYVGAKALSAAVALGTTEMIAIARHPVWTRFGDDALPVDRNVFVGSDSPLPRAVKVGPASGTAPVTFPVTRVGRDDSVLTVRLRSTTSAVLTSCPPPDVDFCANVKSADGLPGVAHQAVVDGRVESRSLLVLRPGGRALYLEVRGDPTGAVGQPALTLAELAEVAGSPRWDG
ncbi:hypothetical protein [Embleya scabrispora]|uniref:hypothetical protein n=1 Tax=Embleya scabrispora TaxID=159449 RepID=UPI00038228C6|nr:hypothetical protein [Embleya scabrispora]MYS81675.1 hypothetical protein [Streptomyces sp. SID5474]